MKKALKIGCLVIILGIVAIVGIFGFVLFGSNTKSTEDVAYYRALSGETDGPDMMQIFVSEFDMPCPYDLPQLSGLGSYADIRFNYSAIRESVFQSHAYTLIVEYDDNTYEVQKLALQEKYTYCTEQSQGFADGKMTEHKYIMDAFEIHAVEGGRYPAEMLFIGYSDSRKEIAIIYFYDQDLDYIDDPLGKFITENTGWRKVVK